MLDAEALGLQLAERDAASGGPVLDDGETVLHTFERLQLVVGAAADQGDGTLFITEGRIIWLSADATRQGYACGFPTVAMHAVVADDESGNRPCLYLQLDNGDDEEGGGAVSASGSEDEEGEEEEELSPELRLVPADASQLDALFQAFCEGAERNPDHSEGSEDEDAPSGGAFFYDQDAALAGVAAASLGFADVEELVGADPGRFEDAEGDDEYEEFGGEEQPKANGGC